MRLSPLQKFILLKCYEKGGRIDRKFFRDFYVKQDLKAKEKYQESIITKSLESLIDRELMIGFGRRTAHKWFITHVKLTKKGKNRAEEVLQESQEKLPL
ncbi:hypothetical protein KJ785_04250 [Patescibacteria group bacterium]|nr:hypothetical protein [Patescibacteria group bacterium]